MINTEILDRVLMSDKLDDLPILHILRVIMVIAEEEENVK